MQFSTKPKKLYLEYAYKDDSFSNYILYALSSSPIEICINFVCFEEGGQYCQDGGGYLTCVITTAVREVSDFGKNKIDVLMHAQAPQLGHMRYFAEETSRFDGSWWTWVVDSELVKIILSFWLDEPYVHKITTSDPENNKC